MQPEMQPQPQSHPPSAQAYHTLRAAIRDLLHNPAYDDGSYAPVLVRLAWHASGTYDAATSTGGSNGAGMRYEAEGGDPANAGLQHARVLLEPLKARFPWVTYADLWTLAGAEAIAAAGGPAVAWRAGRTDFVDDSRVAPRGRLPDGGKGAAHVREVFGRMGFSDREAVALCGAHSLGRCHEGRSGFEGQWVHNPTRFSNQYFKVLVGLEWKEVELKSGVRQWEHVDEELGVKLMMLPSDVALLQDPEFRVWVDRYAESKELFFDDFAKAFAKLLELGLVRDKQGRVTNEDNVKGGYVSAPKKSDGKGAPGGSNTGTDKLLSRQNKEYRARL